MKKSIAIILTCILLLSVLCSCGVGTPNDTGDSANNAGNSGQNQNSANAVESKLSFVLINNDTEYEVAGIGEETNTDIKIPSTYNGKPVTSIGVDAFEGNSKLKSINIPSSIKLIDNYAFKDCKALASVTFEPNSSLTTMGKEAFCGCERLESIIIPSSVTTIGEGTFSASIVGFDYTICGLKSVTFEENSKLTSIGEMAFGNCENLESITIPDSVTSVGDSAFEYCNNLESVTIGNGVTSISESAFSSCESLESVTIGNGVTSIGNYAFLDCTSLTNINIPDGVISIGESAFMRCQSLECVTIGNGVKNIGEDAFNSCESLTNITYNGTQNQWNAISKAESWDYFAESYTIHYANA